MTEANRAAHEPAFDLACEYSDNLPAILEHLNISLALTSYQAGRLILLRSSAGALELNCKRFPRPMGLSANSRGLTLGTFTQVLHFQREDGLLAQMRRPLPSIEDDRNAARVDPATAPAADPSELGLHAAVDSRVDACFIARAAHYTGMINIHDIAWGDEGLWAVNSSFSCLCTLDAEHSFVPRWKPPFISELAPQDRCHLNGMALRDGRPAYATTFSRSNEPFRWRSDKRFEGTLLDVGNNDVLVDGLCMPHSPRWHEGRIYFCDSGRGRICSIDANGNGANVIATLPGFTRGVDFHGDLMFVGLSRLRTSEVANPPPLASSGTDTLAGLALIDLREQRVVAQLRFTGSLQQIYDVAVLRDCCFPELIEPTHPRLRNHFSYPPLRQ